MPAQLPSSLTPACITLALSVPSPLSMYRVSALLVANAPTQFVFEGSYDNVRWSEVDWRTAETWTANQTRDFPIFASVDQPYQYYRLRIIATPSGTALIASVQVYAKVDSITAHGVGQSESSQQHAQQLAVLAAEANAATDLAAHCRQVFTATARRTKPCSPPPGFKTGVGKGVSFISQDDALKQAQDEAEAKADILLGFCGEPGIDGI